LSLATRFEEDELVIAIRDDGCGIDWDKLAESAKLAGLATDSHEDRIQALFVDGVTTRDVVSEVSGRGIGLGAVLAETKALGGRIEVDSARGEGTTFRFVFPRASATRRTDSFISELRTAAAE
jgi:two-component system chemotaxis sensor kinase CheA